MLVYAIDDPGYGSLKAFGYKLMYAALKDFLSFVRCFRPTRHVYLRFTDSRPSEKAAQFTIVIENDRSGYVVISSFGRPADLHFDRISIDAVHLYISMVRNRFEGPWKALGLNKSTDVTS